ncbi:M48 family metalloprotease [Micromonospora sp. KC723]|uniref:M48 family metalloprotease n=1 Tax=Micromonospora sp. KC723 TaxID=2530381 RepID=UPI00104A3D0D|nr:M48 family metalloprotease [Micromonospora sp. KC723]TDB70499.1 hypothetical protein E1165_25520 [Micromonospora sp. KC723]
MSAPPPVWRGRPDETGFLLLPLAALVFSTAVLLAVEFGLSVLARPGCGLGDVLDHPCSEMLVRMSNFFNLMAVPGAAVFAWQTRLHRRRTRPIPPEVFGAAERVIAEVLASVRLRRDTPVLLGPQLGRRAFTGGTDHKPYVALGPELLALPAKGPQGRLVFEAVLRHELAHVQNHDLLRLRFATVLRISTRVTAVATALLLLAQLAWADRPPATGTVLGIVLRAALVAVTAELVTRAFLRLREQQADARAAGVDPDGVRAALRGGGRADTPEVRWARAWQRLWDRHPSVANRLAGLADPAAALALPLGLMLAGGVFTGVALANVQLLVDLLRIAEVLAWPPAGGVAWGALAVLALAVIQPAIFLADGAWRDARGRRLVGRPARPGLLGLVFGVGLFVGTYLAPYDGLVHQSRPEGVPLSGLLLLALGTVLLSRWLTGLLERTGPTTSAGRRLLLLPALPVAVGVLVLGWETTLWLRGRANECAHHLVQCGPLDAVRVPLTAVSTAWAAAVLALGVVTLLAVTVRRAGRAALVPAAGAALAGALLALVLPRVGLADALAARLWARLEPDLGAPVTALTLQLALLVAVTLAAALPRASAGPLAGGVAAVVLAAGLDARLAQWADSPEPPRPGDVLLAVGTHLGAGLGIVLLAVAATLAVRALVAGSGAAGAAHAETAGALSGRPTWQRKPRMSSLGTSEGRTGPL